jgi:flagellar hook assembly protein FlgD
MHTSRTFWLPIILALMIGETAEARVSHGYSGIFALDTVTAVGDDVGGPPHATTLAVIYPNPFNPRATIEFDLAQAGCAELAIFDTRGRLVRIMMSGTQPRGRHRTMWDGRDNAGRAMVTGTYFCRLKTDQMSQIRKLTLAR